MKEIEITLKGKGGHSSRPEECSSPISAGFFLIRLLEERLWLSTPGQNKPLAELTAFDAGNAKNIIPDQGHMIWRITRGEETFLSLLEKAAPAVKEAWGVDAEWTIVEKEEKHDK